MTAGTVEQQGSVSTEVVREHFPILRRSIHGKQLAYPDNGGSSLKPQAMVDRLKNFYSHEFANTNEENRLSRAATQTIEEVRSCMANALGAASAEEIVFVRSATEAVNLVAYAFERSQLSNGDEVVATETEHDSNFLPWQIACERSGAKLRIVPIQDSGLLDLSALEATLSDRTKIIAIAHVSNVFETVYHVHQIASIARRRGIALFLDGAQAAPHLPVNVRDIGYDFYAIPAHKMGGPTGVGILYGRREWLEKFPLYQVGGTMASSVSPTTHKGRPIPKKFEAGAEAISEIVAFCPALRYCSMFGMPTSRQPQEVERALDGDGIVVRSGMLNARILMDRLKLPGAVRASFTFYTTAQECVQLVESLRRPVTNQVA
jgi:cysteine desulfurase / selenocysteine lyase